MKTPKGVLRQNRIQIKEVPLPVNPPAPTIDTNRPAQTTDVLRIATKPPSPQSTVQPRVAAKPPSIEHTPPSRNTNQQDMSIPGPAQGVHTLLSLRQYSHNFVLCSYMVLTYHRVLQLHRLVIEPLNYTYHTSMVLVAPSEDENWNYVMTYPLVTKRIITHFSMENNDPVIIEQRYHLRKQNNPFPIISQAPQ